MPLSWNEIRGRALTFPCPEPSDRQHTAIEAAAREVLDARGCYPQASLADLYGPRTMPLELPAPTRPWTGP